MGSDKRTRYLTKKKKKEKNNKNNILQFPGNFVKYADGFRLSNYPTSKRRLSEMIITITEPFLLGDETDDIIYLIGIMAWNVSIVPSARATMPIPDGVNKKGFNKMIDLFIERKNQFFPTESRIIINFSVEDYNNRRTLVVASTK